ncbi:Disease resistance protein [Melia azedarach]|uniref:Disease resistance protein n=1 Tax=Melia azedarach TaxID=155640 RepID=A0ACC1YKD3_MELAZ|nr:Disease resistance protein [Melia azedarach]
MEHLEYIDLVSTKIKELPSSIEHVEGLTKLRLSDCSELYSLPENLQKLKSLKLIRGENSAICQLPSSITDLDQLEKLSFSGCKGLVLPPLSGISNFKELCLNDCDIREIPLDIGCLSSLERLYLRGNNFESLPTSIKQLSCLTSLHLSNCNMLQSLPELPLRLEFFEAKNCKQLQTLPEIPSCLEELDASLLETPFQYSEKFLPANVEFRFNDCPKLNEKEILADSQLRIQTMAIASLKLFHVYETIFVSFVHIESNTTLEIGI